MAVHKLFPSLLFVMAVFPQWTQPAPTNFTEIKVFSHNRVCFYSYSEDLKPEQLNPHYCTHIVLYFGGISAEFTLTANTEAISRLQSLKTKNPNLKIMLSIYNVSQIVNSQQLTDRFIEQSIEFLATNKLDGLDIDWEFPAWGGDDLGSRWRFPLFLKKYMEALISRSNATGEPRLILSADVAAPLTIMITSYDIPQLAKYVDFVNIMCYDFHFYTWYDTRTGSNAPLFERDDEIIFFDTMNTAWAAKAWHVSGMPKSKINVGIPTYGHTYKLKYPSEHGFGAPTSGPGMYGGWINYPQVCSLIKNGSCNVVFDEESQVPYLYKDNDWVSYDNERSFISKTKHVLDNEYAGIMIFSLNSDDYLGICDDHGTPFPLTETVFNVTKDYVPKNPTPNQLSKILTLI